MPALTLTLEQTNLINSIKSTIEQAFANGVNDNTSAQLVAAINLYNTLTDAQKTEVKAIFLSTLSAFLASTNGFNGSISTSGGTITVVNGIITAVS